MGPRDPGEAEDLQGGVVAEARFRIPVQNLAGAGGQRLGGERSSWFPDHPGGPQFFSLGLSARKSQRPEGEQLSSLSTTCGIIKKINSVFSKQATLLLGSPIFRFLF